MNTFFYTNKTRILFICTYIHLLLLNVSIAEIFGSDFGKGYKSRSKSNSQWNKQASGKQQQNRLRLMQWCTQLELCFTLWNGSITCRHFVTATMSRGLTRIILMFEVIIIFNICVLLFPSEVEAVYLNDLCIFLLYYGEKMLIVHPETETWIWQKDLETLSFAFHRIVKFIIDSPIFYRNLFRRYFAIGWKLCRKENILFQSDRINFIHAVIWLLPLSDFIFVSGIP